MDHLGMRVVDKSTETKHMHIKDEYTTRVSGLIPTSSHRLSVCTRFRKCAKHPEEIGSENTQTNIQNTTSSRALKCAEL